MLLLRFSFFSEKGLRTSTGLLARMNRRVEASALVADFLIARRFLLQCFQIECLNRLAGHPCGAWPTGKTTPHLHLQAGEHIEVGLDDCA
ncbi:hypothetical protein [Paraburkholderia fynbosensis]|uniref:hypothetical protein n=1 Tax=Paraburkholderia fynbosensis TaxID=1200993 RepID=UPI0015822E84|nr:hypothetical protein [Paraburkholderia fynbosensis]